MTRVQIKMGDGSMSLVLQNLISWCCYNRSKLYWFWFSLQEGFEDAEPHVQVKKGKKKSKSVNAPVKSNRSDKNSKKKKSKKGKKNKKS